MNNIQMEIGVWLLKFSTLKFYSFFQLYAG